MYTIHLSFIRRIADKKQTRNTHSLIYKLPLELLVKIFHIALEEDIITYHFKKLYTLARVSRKWNNVVRHTPSFWPYIASPSPLSFVTKAISKSMPYPLHVDLRLGGRRETGPEILQKVMEQIKRWGGVRLNIDYVEGIRKGLEVPAPLITRFDLTLPSHLTARSINLFNGQADRLKHLRLTGIAIPFRSPILRGLRHLELEGIDKGPSITDIMHALSTSPELHFLSLTRVQGNCVPLPQGHSPLVMTELTHLHLIDMSKEYCTTLLPSIRAPNCTHFTLAPSIEMDWNEEADEPIIPNYPFTTTFLNDTVGHFIDQIKSILSEVKSLYFRFDAAEFVMEDLDSLSRLSIDLSGIAPMEAFRWLVDTFAVQLAEPPTTIHAEGPSVFSEPGFLPSLEKLKRVVEIKADTNARDVKELLEFLRQEGWQLPFLQVPKAEEWQLQDLLTMVRIHPEKKPLPLKVGFDESGPLVGDLVGHDVLQLKPSTLNTEQPPSTEFGNPFALPFIQPPDIWWSNPPLLNWETRPTVHGPSLYLARDGL